MSDHPSRDTLADWIRGTSTGADAEAVERHLVRDALLRLRDGAAGADGRSPRGLPGERPAIAPRGRDGERGRELPRRLPPRPAPRRRRGRRTGDGPDVHGRDAAPHATGAPGDGPHGAALPALRLRRVPEPGEPERGLPRSRRSRAARRAGGGGGREPGPADLRLDLHRRATGPRPCLSRKRPPGRLRSLRRGSRLPPRRALPVAQRTIAVGRRGDPEPPRLASHRPDPLPGGAHDLAAGASDLPQVPGPAPGGEGPDQARRRGRLLRTTGKGDPPPPSMPSAPRSGG